MNTQYAKGTRLLIELAGGKSYEGSFCFGDEMKITVSDVSEYPEKVRYNFLYHFYKMEIETITILQNNADPVETETIDLVSQINNSLHYDKLKELAHTYKYISVVDSRYHSAIEYLNICSEIAVFGFGNIYGRNSKISLLAVASKNEIFLFDIKLSGERAFDLGLKDLLEADNINKIVYDGKLLADCLLHCYKVMLSNVFDVQVSDYMIVQKEQGSFPEKMRVFADIVHIYLNIPASLIKNSETSHKHKQLMERPLKEDLKLNSALQVAYLYPLKDILNKRASPNIYLTTQCYLDCMRNEDHVTSLKYLKLDVPSKVKELGLTLN